MSADEHVIIASIIGMTVVITACVLTRQAGDYLLTTGLMALAALGGISGGQLIANGKVDKPPKT